MIQSLATPTRRFLFAAGQRARSNLAGTLQKAVTGSVASTRCRAGSGAV